MGISASKTKSMEETLFLQADEGTAFSGFVLCNHDPEQGMVKFLLFEHVYEPTSPKLTSHRWFLRPLMAFALVYLDKYGEKMEPRAVYEILPECWLHKADFGMFVPQGHSYIAWTRNLRQATSLAAMMHAAVTYPLFVYVWEDVVRHALLLGANALSRNSDGSFRYPFVNATIFRGTATTPPQFICETLNRLGAKTVAPGTWEPVSIWTE